MANNGLLGKSAIDAARAYTKIYTVSAGRVAKASFRLINLDPDNSVSVRLAICPSGYQTNVSPTLADWYEPKDLTIPAAGVLENTAVVMSAGEVLVVYASAATVVVRAHGFESLPQSSGINGLLGKAGLIAATYTPIYSVSENNAATCNVRVINSDPNNSVSVRLAICPSGYQANVSPTLADWIEPKDLIIPPRGVLEDTAMAMAAGEVLVAYTNGALVTVRAHGFESMPQP